MQSPHGLCPVLHWDIRHRPELQLWQPDAAESKLVRHFLCLIILMDSLLLSENCVRTNKGYCRIQWQQSPGTTPDTFQLDTQDVVAGGVTTIAAGGVLSPDPADPTALAATLCAIAYVQIPDASVNGITPLPLPPSGYAFQSNYCGGVLGVMGTLVSTAITCKSGCHVWACRALKLEYMAFPNL